MAKRLVAITGANRGYGLALAAQFAKAQPNTDFVLSHRSGVSLADTIAGVRAEKNTGTVTPWELDMAQPASVLEASTKALFTPALLGQYSDLVFIHNAGTLGPVDAKVAGTPSEVTPDFFHVNVSAFSVVNAAVLSACRESSATKLTVVNISSLCAIKAFTGFGLYCSAKAARDMLVQVMALDHPEVRALNWAPGPMQTDMVAQICDTHCDQGIRDIYTGMVASGSIVDPQVSAAELVALLEHGFEQGAHLDYFDVSAERKKREE